MYRPIAFSCALLLSVGSACAQNPGQNTSPRATALIIVDNTVYPEIKTGLATYAAHVLKQHNVACQIRPDDYYDMKPVDIRAILKAAYETPATTREPRLVGAIMVGPIPHALRGDPNSVLIPTPLYYEDFEAKWVDKNGDGVFEEIITDRKTNPTEIWTAWWVPPANDRPTQTKLLKVWLDKLDRYYRDEITGRDQMLWLAGNVINVEICEGWTVLLKDTMQPLDQELKIWCRVGQDAGTYRPNKRAEEFSPRDFLAAFTLKPWQHCHIIGHGNARGWYWGNTGVVAAARGDGNPEWTLLMDLSTFKGTAGNIVTTSGCSNGNFRGAYIGPEYDKSIGNLLLFSPDTITIAYYGAASPQSTSGFAGYCTEIVESLKTDGGSYIAEGYYKMRNSDYSWGTQHYFFRGGDEKVLSGDPFARYRPSVAPSATELTEEQKNAVKRWTVVGE